MRMPRFRIRTMMIAVAVVAACLGVAHRRSQLLGLAEYHRSQQVPITEKQAWIEPGPWSTIYEAGGKWLSFKEVQQLERLNDWHAALSSKYKEAARYPWLLVEPDTPEPK